MSETDSRRQWPLRPMPIPWLRGPAWIDGDDIVMDRARASTYHALAEPGIGVELARVRTPDDAVAFAGRFGLLRQPMSLAGEPLKPLRQSFRSFEVAAEDLGYILDAERLVRHGTTSSDPETIGQLRQMLLIPEDQDVSVRDDETGELVTRRAGDVYTPAERFVGADDRTILMHAHEYLVARPLTEGMADSLACVHDRTFVGESVPPGTLRIGIRPNSLEAICYLSVALAFVERASIGICADPTCGRPFFIEDKRQRFCSKACGNRVRFRRFMDKQGTPDDRSRERLMPARRGRGEGSIVKRSDGRWMAQADLGWRDGKRRRKTL